MPNSSFVLGPVGRFAARSMAAFVALAVLVGSFGLLATLVQVEWAPVHTLDRVVADGLNDLVADTGVLREVLTTVTDLGGTAMLLWLLVIGVVWLLLRRQRRLAAYVAVTASGGMLLNAVVKDLVGRLRPVVEDPVYAAPGLSFPSGHAMSSLVCYGVLLVVFAPTLHRRARRAFTVVVAVIVFAVGCTRMALGVHYLSDVVAGWLLGALWLLLTTLAFHRWREETHSPVTGPLPGNVPASDVPDLRPVPEQHPQAMPHPWRGLGILAIAWVFLIGALFGIGELVTADGGEPPPLAVDHATVSWLAGHRDPVLTEILHWAGMLGSTPAVLAGTLVVAPLAVAVTRTWGPALFVAVAVFGELTLFLATTALVDRHRPDVPQLNPNLPPTSSFPSGHVAAAVVLYTSAALLAVSLTRRWWRWAVVVLAVIVPLLIAGQRLYGGVHYPSDIAGSLLLAVPWTFIAWRVTAAARKVSPPAPSEDDSRSLAGERPQ